ncbi:MAG: hypothetical protein OEY19_04440 [Gammaproteobacteria bacterium]|nr:hypothetical protein [Gammaproteobacteria bacterium]MDH5629769.1 hypothetical protein [Gammaproteobacteria bacterium]
MNKQKAKQSDVLSASDQQLAYNAHLYFLLNLTFLPLIAFIWSVLRYFKQKRVMSQATRHHFLQSLVMQFFSGILLIGVSGLIVEFGGWQSPYTIMILIIYFTCIHSLLILAAVYAMSKTAGGKDYDYPMLGQLVRKCFASQSNQRTE